jgi:TPP-dependent pyruvate/acetoin dehydrogenase alpha subunit
MTADSPTAAWAVLRTAVDALEAELATTVSGLDQRRFIHSSRGAELAPAVVTYALRGAPARYALYYRCHAWLLALGGSIAEVAVAVRAGAPLSPMQPIIRALPVAGVFVTVGSQLPLALGVALAGRGPTVVSVGDGALSTGVSLESLNVAALHRPDLLLTVEDNDRVVGLPGSAVLAAAPLELAETFGLPAHRLDANTASDDPRILEDAVEWIQATAGGPRLLHVRSGPVDAHCLAFEGAPRL